MILGMAVCFIRWCDPVILGIGELFYLVLWSCDLFDAMILVACGLSLRVLCRCRCVYYWENSETKGVMFQKIWGTCQIVLIMISRSTFLHDIVEWLGRWCALLINRIIMRKRCGYIGLSVGKMLAIVGFFLAIKEVLLQCITNKSVLYRAKV